MNKNEYLAELMDWHHKPEEEQWTGFTAVVHWYSSKQEADKMLAQFIEKQAPVIINSVKFAFKKAWMEDQDGRGRVLAEYARE